MTNWTFLTNHAVVLQCIAADPDLRAREIAATVGITERAAMRIISQLEDAGYVSHERVGRRNRYRVHADLPMRHTAQSGHPVRHLLALFEPPPSVASRTVPVPAFPA